MCKIYFTFPVTQSCKFKGVHRYVIKFSLKVSVRITCICLLNLLYCYSSFSFKISFPRLTDTSYFSPLLIPACKHQVIQQCQVN